MGPCELVDRSRQAVAKCVDWLAVERLPRWPRPRIGGAPAQLGERLERSFFLGAIDRRSFRLLREQFPEACQAIVRTADAALAGRFDLLGYLGLSFGEPVDWHADPVNKRRAASIHWSRLDPLDAKRVG